MATVKYTPQNLRINVHIAKDNIEIDDTVSIYETTLEPSGSGVLIAANIKGVETDDDPSFGDSYLFTTTKIVSGRPHTYSFFATSTDKNGNESTEIDSLVEFFCLTPKAPAVLDFTDLDFGTNTSGSISMASDAVAQWKMNDLSGTTVTDDIQGYNGTNTNPINSVTGKINTAIDYNGTTDYTTLPNFSDINTSDFTICFWIKTTDSDGTILHKYNDTGTIEEGFRIYYETSLLKIEFNTFGGGGIITLDGTSIPPTGDWTFVTATFDRSGNMSLFKNSVFNKSEDISVHDGVSMNQSGFPLLFGVRDNSTVPIGDYFDGTLDNVCIFDRLLTQTEINWLYKNGNGTEELDADLSTEFQTVFHFDILDPETIIEDGDYDIDDTNIGVDLPVDGAYEWYRTYSNAGCSTESDQSNLLSVLIDSSTPSQVSLSDPYNLFLNNIADGKFKLVFNYNFTTGDPIDSFNIYADNSGDISTGGNWVLDGTLNYSSITNRFTYTTEAQLDGTLVSYYILPVAGVNERFNDTAIISGTADAQAPIVTDSTMTATLL